MLMLRLLGLHSRRIGVFETGIVPVFLVEFEDVQPHSVYYQIVKKISFFSKSIKILTENFYTGYLHDPFTVMLSKNRK